MFVWELGQTLVYERKFSLVEETLNGRVFLHFGAVDSECEVYINGELVGGHRGGFTPFSLDITKNNGFKNSRVTLLLVRQMARDSVEAYTQGGLIHFQHHLSSQ